MYDVRNSFRTAKNCNVSQSPVWLMRLSFGAKLVRMDSQIISTLAGAIGSSLAGLALCEGFPSNSSNMNQTKLQQFVPLYALRLYERAFIMVPMCHKALYNCFHLQCDSL